MIDLKAVCAVSILVFAAVANAGIVDPENSWAVMQNEPAVLLIAPGGAESFIAPVDHRIDVYVNDSGMNPVEIVASDIWLENLSTVPCPGGWIADSSTFAPDPGHTTITSTPRGGVPHGTACRNAHTSVIAIGFNIQDLDLRFISPDLDGDGHVTVIDFAVFGDCFYEPCESWVWCADLDKSDEQPPDPCVTLVDFAIFASYYNISDCP